VLAQFVLLNQFLGTSYRFWGFEILRDLANGVEWQESGHFPRVTMCDFEVRVLGNKHRHTVQCVLMINMFNEKVYLFVWWWLLLVAVATAWSLLYWITASSGERRAVAFIRQYLHVYRLLNFNDKEEVQVIRKFVNRFLRPDGVFLLRLIAANAGDLITTDVVFEIYKLFLMEEARGQQTLPMREPGAPSRAILDDVDAGHKSEDDG